MSIHSTNKLHAIVTELIKAHEQIPQEQIIQLVNRIKASRRIFVAGAGRSGLMMKAFAMRLMHLGLDAYVVGDTITRSIDQGDLLLIGSGSGETKTLLPMAQKAKGLDASVVAITLNANSTLGALADYSVILPGAPKDHTTQESTIQPMGSLFEQLLLLVCDASILYYMESQDLNSIAMYGNHANLE